MINRGQRKKRKKEFGSGKSQKGHDEVTLKRTVLVVIGCETIEV